jgi:hypothetical protein
MEGASISEQPPGVDAPAVNRDQVAGNGTVRGTGYRRPAKRRQRISIDRVSGELKRRRCSRSRGAFSVRQLAQASSVRRVDRTEAGARAVEHAAAGGGSLQRWCRHRVLVT